jgi:farnesyl diphosphate synthase
MTSNNRSSSLPHSPTYPLAEIEAAGDDDKLAFQALYPTLRDELLQDMRDANEMQPEAIDYLRRMMDYNVPGGKLNRGTTVIDVYRVLLGKATLTPTETARAAVLGWAIEFLQAFFLVADDVMDDSQTRRGQPCWYKLPDVQLVAINDSFLLESFVFAILRRHFGHEPFYLHLLELMLDVTHKTELGQLLDLTSQPPQHHDQPHHVDLDRFTLTRYQQIVKYKTAFYSFYLPVAMGMILSGVTDAPALAQARTICCLMGEYFQIQDDYLDCFGDPAVIGKVGTDIQDNKCSWLVVQALARCTPAQRDVLQNHYGQSDDQKVETVKSLYRELQLVEVFHAYEEDSYAQIQAQLEQVHAVPKQVFVLFLNKIYKRSK